MTLDGFLTFLALIIAAYNVASSVTRLRLKLHFIWLGIISVIGFLLVLYFEFFSLLGHPCPEAFGGYCRFLTITSATPVNTGQAAFAVVIVWLLLAWIPFKRSKLPPRALPILARLVSELAYERRYADLVELIDPHLLLTLDRAAQRQLTWATLHDRLLALDHRRIGFFNQLLDSPIEISTADLSLRRRVELAAGIIVSKLASIVPSQRRAADAAKNIFRVLFLSPEVTAFIANFRPEFGVQLLSCSFRAIQDFADAYLTALISNSRSSLYTEIKQNQNEDSSTGYWFTEHNPLLYFLFNDARTAERLHVWGPLGEYTLSALRPTSDPGYITFLNGSADSFKEGKWKDQTFVTIRFFDLMVTAAEYQGVRWHMWLYYFRDFIDQIVALYDASGPDIDPNVERPTRASYLIYEVFYALLKWITAVKYLPHDSPHLILENDEVAHENGSIPKSAILALGMCFGKLVLAPSVGQRFKQYIHDVVMEGMRDLSKTGVEGRLRALLIMTIVQGGLSEPTQDYGEELKRLFGATDHVAKAELDDYRVALDQAFP
jgi:hypothetical protein